MIQVFIDGPIGGDVRTDFPPQPPGGVVRVPIPLRETWCYCNEDYPSVTSQGPEIVEYRVLCSGPRVQILSCEQTDDEGMLMRSLNSFITSDLTKVRWDRECRDRRAYR